MDFLGVPAPLRSFAWVTVNGEPWGLFLARWKSQEESFARRNFGVNHGQLYKPDYRLLLRRKPGRAPALHRRLTRRATRGIFDKRQILSR